MSYWSTVSRAEGHWPLQDDTSGASVIAAAGPDGTYVGSTSTSLRSTGGPTSWLPKALSFDGLSQYIATGQTDGSWSEATLAAWMKTVGQQVAYSGVVIRRGMLSLHSFTDNRLRYNWSNRSSEYSHVGPLCTPGQWTHVALRVRSDRVDFFVNGVQAGGKVIAHPPVVQSMPVTIGLDAAIVDRYFKGDLAGVQVYSEALSDAEIDQIASGPEPTLLDSPGLIGRPGVGRLLRWLTGGWDAHSNGQLSLTWALQSSNDGIAGWQDVPGTAGVNEYVVPPSLASKALRLAVVASNDGGEAEAAFSEVASVETPSWPARLVARSVRTGGPVVAAVRSTGDLQAGLVLPVEATINQ